MLDLSVPFYPVIMVCEKPEKPTWTLPEGVQLVFWEEGREKDWCRVHMEAGQLSNMEKAMGVFDQEFAPYPDVLRKNMFFLYENGRALATMTLWQGDHLGRQTPRLHWLSCVPDYQGRGLGKLMMQISLWLYHERGCTDALYLTTQTTSYPAINIYKKFGFVPYQPDATEDRKTAWQIIDQKINEYQQGQ